MSALIAAGRRSAALAPQCCAHLHGKAGRQAGHHAAQGRQDVFAHGKAGAVALAQQAAGPAGCMARGGRSNGDAGVARLPQ